jgi:hypothetical protein
MAHMPAVYKTLQEQIGQREAVCFQLWPILEAFCSDDTC